MAKYGIREICDVVFKAKGEKQYIGSKQFTTGQPVIYFDSLKTSSLEGAATTVYATGGKGNPRLVAWDGERTLTFNMEDALISPMGLAILAGAGLINPGDTGYTSIQRHVTERIKANSEGALIFSKKKSTSNKAAVWYGKTIDGNLVEPMKKAQDGHFSTTEITEGTEKREVTVLDDDAMTAGDFYIVDYYVDETAANSMTQIDIDPSKFAGSFYIEGSTLWRDENGQDHPVEIVIPNGKVQSNFTFNMSSSGDPSTFNFVVDALADYTTFDQTHKVLAAMQVMEETVKL